MDTPQRPGRRLQQTPIRNNHGHPELFIPKRFSSAKKNITPRSSVARLSGIYTPSQVNPSPDLNEPISYRTIDEKVAAKFADMPEAIASVVELLMWHDKPTRQTRVKMALVRQRVAAELQLPIHSFVRNDWKKEMRRMVDIETVRNTSGLIPWSF